MLHSLHLETPCLTNICGWTNGRDAGPPITPFLATFVVAAVGDVVFDSGNVTFDAIFSASSKFDPSSKCWADEFRARATEFGSAKRAASSLTRSGRRIVDAACVFEWFKWRLVARELGDRARIPRGLHELRLGDGVNGGEPGNDGAHTICSGDVELLLFSKRFSLPSFRTSIFTRCKSPDTEDEIDAERSRYERSTDNRRTDKSNGVVLPSLMINEINFRL